MNCPNCDCILSIIAEDNIHYCYNCGYNEPYYNYFINTGDEDDDE